MQRSMPKWIAGQAYLKDQLERAMSSAVLNVVEGNGRRTQKDRQRFFTQSTASLCEVHACLELIKIQRPHHEAEITSLQRELEIIYAMIRRLP